MKMRTFRLCAFLVSMIAASSFVNLAHADIYADTIELYQKSEAVKPFFKNCYGYAVFPTIGKGGIGIGGAYGTGQVYQGGKVTGKISVVKMSIGWQLGGQAYSQIIFFEDKRAYKEFTSGSFEFDASTSVVAVTAGTQAKVGSEGATAGASAGPATGAHAEINYSKGMAVFVHTKGGLMYEAALGGQKYNFTPIEGGK